MIFIVLSPVISKELLPVSIKSIDLPSKPHVPVAFSTSPQPLMRNGPLFSTAKSMFIFPPLSGLSVFSEVDGIKSVTAILSLEELAGNK